MKRKGGMMKRRFKRRRVVRRRTRRFRGFRSSKPKYHFKRMAGTITFTGNVAYAPWTSSYQNKLSDIVNVTEFSSLFDQYKLNKVVHKVWLSVDPSAQTATTAVYPRFFWARDLDDSAIPASIDELRQYANCKTAILTPMRPITIVYKPNILDEVYSGVGSTNYVPKWGQWLDMSNTNTLHFGFKAAMDDFTNTAYKINIERYYYFSCKNVR